MNPRFALLIFSILSLTQISTALAHGEDKPGPHGGHIRMPGAFHTELLVSPKGEMSVYLLDINWKNPTTQGDVQIRDSKRSAVCEKQKDYFKCQFNPALAPNKVNKIFIKAVREGQVGNEVSYDLPLPHRKTP